VQGHLRGLAFGDAQRGVLQGVAVPTVVEAVACRPRRSVFIQPVDLKGVACKRHDHLLRDIDGYIADLTGPKTGVLE